MIIVMGVNLYSVRLLIRGLGLEQYGVLNVVAGIVGIFLAFSTSMSSTLHRFYSISLGEDIMDIKKRQKIFSSSILTYTIVGFFLILLAEFFGIWFINYKLIIDTKDITNVLWLFQLYVLSFFFTLWQAPFSAILIAHEEMKLFSILSILDSALKLCAAFALIFLSENSLLAYGMMLTVISIFVLFAYIYVVKYKFTEYKFMCLRNGGDVKEMLSFTGWTFLGTAANAGLMHGNTLIVNMFFGPIINGARAVSFQVNNALNSLVSNVVLGMKPPMIKAYAAGAYSKLNLIFYLSNKFIFISTFVLCAPIYYNIELLLSIWIGEVTSEMILFSRLIIVYNIVMNLNNPISIIVHATGKVKWYYILVECLTLSSVVMTYALYKMGYQASATYYTMICAIGMAHVVRLIILKTLYSGYSHKNYVIKFILPMLFFALSIICWIEIFMFFIQVKGFYMYLILHTFIIAWSLLAAWGIGLDNIERRMLKDEYKKLKKI